MFENIIHQLTNFWRSLFFKKTYLQTLASRYDKVDLSTLITREPHPLDLDQVFVEPYLGRQEIHNIQTDIVYTPSANRPSKRKEPTHADTIWHHLKKAWHEDNHLAIIARPGAGKTTLFKHIVLTLAAGWWHRRKVGAPGKVPILLFLHNHTATIRAIPIFDVPTPTGIPSELFQRLSESLQRTEYLRSTNRLSTLFVADELIKWRSEIPWASTPAELAEGVIGLLYNLYDKNNRNGLLLFLRILQGRYDPSDQRHTELDKLATDLSTLLKNPHGPNLDINQRYFNRKYTLAYAAQNSLSFLVTESPLIVSNLVVGEEKYFSDTVPDSWFERQLKRGNCLILLDGLDEISDPAERMKVIDWITYQTQIYKRNRFILTSRPHGVRDIQELGTTILDKSTILEVLAFNKFQIEAFIHNWYLAAEQKGTADISGKEDANRLIEQIYHTLTLRKLAENPLLLTMILCIHRHRRKLPKYRTALYEEAFSVLLHAKNEQDDMLATYRQKVLQSLAYDMMLHRQHEIHKQAAIDIILKPLHNYFVQFDGEAFLRRVEAISGLLKEEADMYSFAHPTFQAYLVACYIKDENYVAALAGYINDPAWYDAMRFYAGMADATPLVYAALDVEKLTTSRFELVMECLGETDSINKKILTRIDEVLRRCENDIEHRRAVNEALATMRNRRMVPLTSAESYVDMELITNAEYQIFLYEDKHLSRGLQGFYPDHWLSIHAPISEAHRPVVGVRPEDAQRFVTWINEIEVSGDFYYRLPKSEDIEDDSLLQGVMEGDVGYWLQTDDGLFHCHGHNRPTTSHESLRDTAYIDVTAPFPDTISTLFDAPGWTVVSVLLSFAELANYVGEYDFSLTRRKSLLKSLQQGMSQALQQSKFIADDFSKANQRAQEIADGHRTQIYAIDCIRAQRQSDLDRLQSDLNAGSQQIKQDYEQVYSQIDAEIERFQSNISVLDQQCSEHQQQIHSKFAQLTGELDGWIADVQSINAANEQKRNQRRQEIQNHYQGEYPKIDQKIDDIQRTLEENTIIHQQNIRNIESSFSNIYQQIDDLIGKYSIQISDLIKKSDEYEISHAVAQCETEIRRLEDERSKYQNKERTELNGSEQASDRILAHNRGIIASYEKERQRLRNAEQKAYEALNTEFGSFIKKNNDIISGYENDKRRRKSEEQSHISSVAQKTNDQIQKIKQSIQTAKQEYNRFQQEERNRIHNLESQYEPNIQSIQGQIRQQDRQYRATQQLEMTIRDQATKFAQYSSKMSDGLQNSTNIIHRLTRLSNAFFADMTQNLALLMQTINTSIEQCKETFNFLNKEFPSDIHEIQRHTSHLESLIGITATLQQIAHMGIRFDSALAKVNRQFYAVQLAALPDIMWANKIDTVLGESLKTSFTFLRDYSRSPGNAEQAQTLLVRLRYIRLCMLAVALQMLNTDEKKISKTKVTEREVAITEYLLYFAMLHTLAYRIEKKTTAFEGIRLVKNRKR